MTERDPYAVLGVPVHADLDAVAAAYREKARRHHPDVSDAPDAEQRMAEINAAWATLRDPDRRAAWDRANLRIFRAPTGTGTRRPSGPAAEPASTATWRRGPNGEGAAGPPPGPRRGSVLPFGRHIGWSLGEIVRVDPGYLAWLKDRSEGAPYRAEIEQLLATMRQAAGPGGAPGQSPAPASKKRRGLFG